MRLASAIMEEVLFSARWNMQFLMDGNSKVLEVNLTIDASKKKKKKKNLRIMEVYFAVLI